VSLIPRITLLGLFSGLGTGAALLIFARSGLGAVLGDAGFYLVLFGVGWFTGKALHQRLSLAEKDRLFLSAAVALAYAAGADPLDALLVEYGLTGVWALPALWLGAVTAALAGVVAWIADAVRTARRLALAALVGVAAMAAIVVAINLLAGVGAPTAGVWAIYLVPALWLPPVTYFRLKPLAQKPIDGL
jgi:hypothetical protein